MLVVAALALVAAILIVAITRKPPPVPADPIRARLELAAGAVSVTVGGKAYVPPAGLQFARAHRSVLVRARAPSFGCPMDHRHSCAAIAHFRLARAMCRSMRVNIGSTRRRLSAKGWCTLLARCV